MKLHKPFIDLFANIIAGTRMAFFMPIHLWSFKVGFVQICLLLAVSFSFSFFGSYFETAPDNFFNIYGLNYQAALYLLFFFSLSLIVCLSSRAYDLDKLIVLFLSIVPAVYLVSTGLVKLSTYQTFISEYYVSWIIFYIYLSWNLLITLRIIKRFLYCDILKSLPYLFIFAVINVPPMFPKVFPHVALWYQERPANVKTADSNNINVESIYYSQNKLLSNTTDRFIDGQHDVTDLFFLGFAGDADEDVFMNETKSAQAIMDDYFNAFGRSMVLINNKKTTNTIPLANSHNLKNGIIEISKRMNLNEDILVLFLTSHGSEDHYISANFKPFKLNSLNADTINSALTAAGIKWRVIIISACYSGGFIEPLSDPYTLVITAASKEQQSFGCGHHDQYTYFGDAYLENGLKQTRSFIQAFNVAKDIILEKENAQGINNSDPQIMIGSEIEKKLEEYEKNLDAKISNNWAATAIK
jgi:peptidase C13-like protein